MSEPDISTLARRLAEQNNVDWRSLGGSGPSGKVVERDVLDYLARVMAGMESVDSTPEPLPEGMEAWPDQDAPSYFQEAEATEAEPDLPFADVDDVGLDATDSDVPFTEAATAAPASDPTPATEPDPVADDLISDDIFLFDPADPEEEPSSAFASHDLPDEVVGLPDEVDDLLLLEDEAETGVDYGSPAAVHDAATYDLEDEAPAAPSAADPADAAAPAHRGFSADAFLDDDQIGADAFTTETRFGDSSAEGGSYAKASPLDDGSASPFDDGSSSRFDEGSSSPFDYGSSNGFGAGASNEFETGTPSESVNSYQSGLEAGTSSEFEAAPSNELDDDSWGVQPEVGDPFGFSDDAEPESAGDEDLPDLWASDDVDQDDTVKQVEAGFGELAEEPGPWLTADDAETQSFTDAAAVSSEDDWHDGGAVAPVSEGVYAASATDDLTSLEEAEHLDELDALEDVEALDGVRGEIDDVAAAVAALPLVRSGAVVRRHLDVSALAAAQLAVGAELGGDPLDAAPFLLRAVAKAASELGITGGQVALAELSKGAMLRRVDDAGTRSFKSLVDELALEGPEEDEVALVAVDLSDLDVDEVMLDVAAPAVTLGRILYDTQHGAYRSTLALTGDLPLDQGARLLSRVAELLDAPVRLLL